MVAGDLDSIGGETPQEPPPMEYFEIEAAQLFGMPFLELHNHAEKQDLLEWYFFYVSNKSLGETGLQYNPQYWKKAKTHLDKVQAAQKAGGFTK